MSARPIVRNATAVRLECGAMNPILVAHSQNIAERHDAQLDGPAKRPDTSSLRRRRAPITGRSSAPDPMQRSVHCLAFSTLLAVLAAPAVCQVTWQPDRQFTARQDFGLAFDPVRGEAVLYGGNDGAVRDETWVWDGAAWQLREPLHRPGTELATRLTWDSARQRIVLCGGSSPLALWEWDGTDWLQITGALVPFGFNYLTLSSFVHDPVRDRLVAFNSDASPRVAEFDGTTWTEVTMAAPWPSNLSWKCAAFDPDSGAIAMLGLAPNESKLWWWNGTVWSSTTLQVPVMRQWGCRLVHDPVAHRLLLAGGTASGANPPTLSALPPGATTPQPLAIGIPQLPHSETVYDTTRSTFVMVGSLGSGTGADSSVYESTGGDWTRRTTTAPEARSLYSVARDAAHDRTWVCAGSSNNTMADLWQLDAAGWHLIWPQTTGQVNPTYDASIVFDEARQELLWFGGFGGPPNFCRWTGTSWQAIAVNTPPVRTYPALAFDREHGVVVMFGGGILNDTWTWDGATWTQVMTPTSPPGNYSYPAMTYDPLRRRILLVLGSDTWEFDGLTWQLRDPGGVIQPLMRSQLAYDEARQTVVAVAKGSTGGTVRTFDWSGSSWTERILAGAPEARDRHGLLPTSAGVRLFGGMSLVAPLRWFATQYVLADDALATVTPFGTPGTSPGGPLELAVVGTGPWLGSHIDLTLTGLPALVLPVLWFGFSNTTWAGLPLPLDLTPLGWPGNEVRIAPEVPVSLLLTGAGSGSTDVNLPLQAALVGTHLYAQALAFDPITGGLTTSNGLDLLTGLR